jgi:hypothetical protein
MTPLENLKQLLANADMQLPCCVDNYICKEGDGGGKWFIFDSSFNDGPPIGEFYNAEGDARLVCALLNLFPQLIELLEWIDTHANRTAIIYDTTEYIERIKFAKQLRAILEGVRNDN